MATRLNGNMLIVLRRGPLVRRQNTQKNQAKHQQCRHGPAASVFAERRGGGEERVSELSSVTTGRGGL
jgi:hypothetical protein